MDRGTAVSATLKLVQTSEQLRLSISLKS